MTEHKERAHILSRRVSEGLLQLIWAPYRERLQGRARSARRDLSLTHLQHGCGVVRIVQDAYAPARKSLMQKLQTLSRKLGRHVREAGDVAARPREVRYHSAAH